MLSLSGHKLRVHHPASVSWPSVFTKVKSMVGKNMPKKKQKGRGLKSLKILCTHRQLKREKDATEGQDARLRLDTIGQALASLSRHTRLPQASLHLWASCNCPDVPELPDTQQH